MLEKVQLKTNLSHKIAAILRQEIYTGKIKAKDHLNEVVLASRFSLSRGPLRDAIKILETEGLVKTPLNGRTVVVGFSTKEINEYYKLRYFLESEAIKKIIFEPKDETYAKWIDELEEILAESKHYLEYDEKDYFTEIDYRFHLSIQLRAENIISIQVWKMLSNISMTIMDITKRYLADRYNNELNSTFAYHDRILSGLKNCDFKLTLENLEIHLSKGREIILRIINEIKDN